jgi:hypothetical protein
MSCPAGLLVPELCKLYTWFELMMPAEQMQHNCECFRNREWLLPVAVAASQAVASMLQPMHGTSKVRLAKRRSAPGVSHNDS